MMTANLVGGVITCGLGVMGLLRPSWAAELTSIRAEGKTGLSEIRATYGGFFLALGAYSLLVQTDVAFSMLGFAWMGAACARLVSMGVDKSTEAKNLGGVLFEGVIGSLLLL